jgi:hypothetical protein
VWAPPEYWSTCVGRKLTHLGAGPVCPAGF